MTLAVSQKLAALIDREPGMRAVMTRRGDYFVDLNKRSEIARKAKADLLVSVHADSFHNSTPRGASVWVLSTNRANREMGSWLEKQEKQGELLGGVGKVLAESDPNPYLAQTFLDLSMDKSRAEDTTSVARSCAPWDGWPGCTRRRRNTPVWRCLRRRTSPRYWWRRALSRTMRKRSCWLPPAIRISWPGPSSRIRNYYRSHPTKGPMMTGKGQQLASVSQPAAKKAAVAPRPGSRWPTACRRQYRAAAVMAVPRSAVSAAPPVPG